MSMDAGQLRALIGETLAELGLHSEQAVELLMLTAAAESNLGQYIRQMGNGPALGIFQMEPATHDDIVANFLRFRAGVALTAQSVGCAPRVPGGILNSFDSRHLVFNLKYAICMARIHYLRVSEPLPELQFDYPSGDNEPERISSAFREGLASYWKRYYNTHLGAGDPAHALKRYLDLCIDAPKPRKRGKKK